MHWRKKGIDKVKARIAMNRKLKIISWALYDLANTIFAANIVSLYFPLWVTIQKNAPDKLYILPYYISMLMAAFILPFFGILSDSLRRHSLFLAIFTLSCIILTAFIGIFNSLFAGIILFSFANLFNQTAGNVFYPALLPQICSKDKIPRVSALGVGLGYIGTIIGLFTVQLFIKESNYSAVFVPTALLFLIFSLPCFVFVRDNTQTKNIVNLKLVIKEGMQKLVKSINAIKKNRAALRFFCSIMLAINGINGVLLNMGVYARKVIGFFDSELPIFIAMSTIFAICSSLVFGFIVERLKPKRTLSLILIGWVVALISVALISRKNLFWIIGPIIGILLAGTWVSSRPLIIGLAPEYRMGEFFGFTGLASISGALISPPIWLFMITVFEPLGLAKYRIAVLSLAFMIAAGFLTLQKVPERKLIE
ncbi:MAG: MFS transporter [Candidatus Omnitrophica bacterium]|nr:MFS transporter [Candidatus Omnitrophota bacterium]